LDVIGALDVPDRGEVWIGDENILQMSERSRARIRRKCIGFIFQNETLMSTYSARENIDLVLRLQGLNFFERRKRATTALEAMGLSAWADHLPEELSGGQRQRVAIARALALRPALILADEPTSGLDTRMARRVLSLFVGIAKTQGTAFLIVSHDSVVTEFVNEAYDLREGLLVRRVDHNGSVLEKIVSSA
jgi:putative ABC transport system ATP-binding protein